MTDRPARIPTRFRCFIISKITGVDTVVAKGISDTGIIFKTKILMKQLPVLREEILKIQFKSTFLTVTTKTNFTGLFFALRKCIRSYFHGYVIFIKNS